MHWKVKTLSGPYKAFLPLAQLLPLPWRNCSFINAQLLIGNHQVGIYTQHQAKAFAGGSGTKWIVERKKVRYWLFKSYSIQFKFIAEGN